MLKLIKRPGCSHCEEVEQYIKFAELDLQKPKFCQIERVLLPMKVVESEYAPFSNTAPILIGDDFFIKGSHNIIDFLKIKA